VNGVASKVEATDVHYVSNVKISAVRGWTMMLKTA